MCLEDFWFYFQFLVQGQDKSRYVLDGYNLDLTYITERIIAMSFPSKSKLESTYRNSLSDVAKMLSEKHGDHYKVYNLCGERPYESSDFQNLTGAFGFIDHFPPPLHLLHRACLSMMNWLESHEDNVVVIHCLAGKGRTGVLACSLLLLCGLFDSSFDALSYFASKRSNNHWGVTNPGQILCVRNYEEIVTAKRKPKMGCTKKIHRMQMFHLPVFENEQSGPIFHVHHNLGRRMLKIYGSEQKMQSHNSGKKCITWDLLDIGVSADITITFTRDKQPKPFCYVSFNVDMLPDEAENVLRFEKYEIDGACNDNRFGGDFAIEVSMVETEEAQTALEEDRRLTLAGKIATGRVKLPHNFYEKYDYQCSDGTLCFRGSEGEKEKKRDAARQTNKGDAEDYKGGYLYKMGQNRKNWKYRWFVLKNKQLSYYKNPKHVNPAGRKKRRRQRITLFFAAGVVELKDVLYVQRLEEPPLRAEELKLEKVLSPTLPSDIVLSASINQIAYFGTTVVLSDSFHFFFFFSFFFPPFESVRERFCLSVRPDDGHAVSKLLQRERVCGGLLRSQGQGNVHRILVEKSEAVQRHLCLAGSAADAERGL